MKARITLWASMSEDIVLVLQKLGLTELQAKVYLALATLENLSVDEIAKKSKVHRPDIYRLVKILEEKGLVERVVASPVRYRALPLDKTFDFLLRKRSKESIGLLKETGRLARKFKAETNQPLPPDLPSIVVIPRARVVDRVLTAIDKAKESIDLVVSRSQFESRMFYLTEKYKNAWDRGVKMRLVVGEPQKEDKRHARLKLCIKNPSCDLKFISENPQTSAEIIDSNEVYINENPAKGLLDSPMLYSNKPSLLHLAKAYFEKVWNEGLKAQEQP
jgi:sugar-specific transcriptional regulator TrmB